MNYYIEQLLLDTSYLKQSGLGGALNNLAASSCSVYPNAACVPNYIDYLIFGHLKWNLDIRIAKFLEGSDVLKLSCFPCGVSVAKAQHWKMYV